MIRLKTRYIESKTTFPNFHPSLYRLVGISSPTVAEAGEQDVVVAIQPGTETMWSKANALKTPAPVVGLNAPFSLSYDIGYKPSVWEQIYVVRRITKGTCVLPVFT